MGENLWEIVMSRKLIFASKAYRDKIPCIMYQYR